MRRVTGMKRIAYLVLGAGAVLNDSHVRAGRCATPFLE